MMEISRFNTKLNKIKGKNYVIEEEIVMPESGIYEAELEHDSIIRETLSVYTGAMLTGTKIYTYSLSTPSLMPWKNIIRIQTAEPKIYISYETDGDMVEAEDVNNLQDAVVLTQHELNAEATRAQSREEELDTAIGTKASDIEFQAHKSNITTHITSTERTNWNLAKTHADSAHAPSSAQKNSDITKGEVVAALGYTPETSGAYENATAYTDLKVAELIGSAPSTLDTLGEIADAMADNQTVVEALDAAIGTKASDVDLQAHKNNSTIHVLASDKAKWDAASNVMTPTTNGIGKPDNVTIGVSNGTFSTKFKNYTSLSDIGLTAPKTCLEIATAMANNSRITIPGNFTTVSDSPTNGGTITIERMFADKAYAWHYAASSGTLVPPECHVRCIRPLDASASSWTKELTSGNLTNNLLATVPGTALDATQGKALDDKIVAFQQSFQDGCDAIMAAVTAKGSTPASNGVSDIVAAIAAISDTRDATMTSAAQLLVGYTAYSKNIKYTGTMANRGAVTSTLQAGQTYTVPVGYHNGSGVITAASLASQTPGNTNADYLPSGHIAWVNGTKITGNNTWGNSVYNSGYTAGVAAADARVNTASASYTAGYNAGKSASPTVSRVTINYYYKGTGNLSVSGTVAAVYSKSGDGTWIKSGNWVGGEYCPGGGMAMNYAEAGITSIVLE